MEGASFCFYMTEIQLKQFQLLIVNGDEHTPLKRMQSQKLKKAKYSLEFCTLFFSGTETTSTDHASKMTHAVKY